MLLHRFVPLVVRLEVAALWQLAWPMLIGQLATVGMAVADVAMAGHASALDLAAVSLGAAVWSIIIVTLMGVMMSVNPLVAHHIGAAEFDQVPHVVRQALWKALGVGVVGTLIANLAAQVFGVMDVEPAVGNMARYFVQIISFALPAFACYRVLYGYSASLNQTKPLMVIALAALGLNIAMNWLLIYGQFGLPKLGGLGCAVSSLVCVWFSLLALIAWMHRSAAYQQTWPFGHWEGPHWPEITRLLRLGLPIGITYFAESSAFGLIALLVAKFGAMQVGAHQIALNFSSLTFMVPLSISIALITRIGLALGEGDPAAARFRAWVGVGLCFAFAIVSAAGIGYFSEDIARLYTTDRQLAHMAGELLVFAAIFQLSDATQVSTSCAIRGYKVTRPPMVIHMTAFWGFCLPLGYWLGIAPAWLPWHLTDAMAAKGFWMALVVGLTVAALGLTWFLNHLSLSRLRHPMTATRA